MADDDSRTSATLIDWLHDPSNRRGWEVFATHYGGKIRQWCLQRGLQEADADEVSQQLLAEIHAKMRSFTYEPTKGRFRDWLRSVVRNACGSYLARDQSRRYRALLEDLPAREELGQELERHVRRELLDAALDRVRSRVAARDWQIFMDLTYAVRPAAEVAGEHGMKVAAVYMTKHRVLGKLKDEVRRLGDEGWGP